MADETGRSRAFFGRAKAIRYGRSRRHYSKPCCRGSPLTSLSPPPAPASLFPDLVDDVRLEIGFGGGEHLMRRGVHVHGRGSVVILLITLWSYLLANHADALVLGAGMLTGTSRQPAPVNTAGGPGRTRTSNQTVMSGPVSPESSDKFDVFRRVRARSFASVHGVSVVYLWSVIRIILRRRGAMLAITPNFPYRLCVLKTPSRLIKCSESPKSATMIARLPLRGPVRLAVQIEEPT